MISRILQQETDSDHCWFNVLETRPHHFLACEIKAGGTGQVKTLVCCRKVVNPSCQYLDLVSEIPPVGGLEAVRRHVAAAASTSHCSFRSVGYLCQKASSAPVGVLASGGFQMVRRHIAGRGRRRQHLLLCRAASNCLRVRGIQECSDLLRGVCGRQLHTIYMSLQRSNRCFDCLASGSAVTCSGASAEMRDSSILCLSLLCRGVSLTPSPGAEEHVCSLQARA